MAVAIALLVIGINFMADKSWFSSERILYAKYKRIDGLTTGNKVVHNGFKVGTVKSVVMDSRGAIVVQFTVYQEGLQIPKGTIAKIKGLGLMESKAIDLVFPEIRTLTDSLYIEVAGELFSEEDSTKNPEPNSSLQIKSLAYLAGYHESGDTLLSGVALTLTQDVNALVLPLKIKAENLIQSMDSVMMFVQGILNKEARKSLGESFGSIERAFANFEKASVNIDSIAWENRYSLKKSMANFEEFTGVLKDNSDTIDIMIKNFKMISDDLAEADLKGAIDNANKTFAEITLTLDEINKGDGTIGKLIKDSVLYVQIKAAVIDLDLVLKDLKDDPNLEVVHRFFQPRNKKKRALQKIEYKEFKKDQKAKKDSLKQLNNSTQPNATTQPILVQPNDTL